MPHTQLALHYQQLILNAKENLKAGDFSEAMTQLAQAHIIGQHDLFLHWSVHFWMLRVAAAQGDVSEILGQVWRIFLTPFGHVTGRLPQGNTGRANVNPFIPMPIPEDLQLILKMNTSDSTALNIVPEDQFSSKPLFFVWVFLASLLTLFDQAIKMSTEAVLPLGSSVAVTPWFNWVHVLNPGAAFSFLADAGGWQRYFFTILACIVCLVLLVLLWRGVKSKIETIAYIFLIGGALGNVIDRIRLGAVVDYLDFYWRTWHWPAFNLADVFVVFGALLLALAAFNQASAKDDI